MKRRKNRRVNRAKVEMLKAKVALVMMIVFTAGADSGIVFMLLAVFSMFYLGVCARRLERLGALDE